MTVLSELRRIALFEFIPYAVVTKKLKAIVPSSDQDEFEEASVLDEMGAMFVIGIGLLLTICITLLIATLCKQKNPTCTRLAFKMKQKLLWNSVIRYSIQSYLKLSFANFAVLTTLHWSTFSKAFKSIFALTISIGLFTLPFVYMLILKDLSKLRDENTIRKFESLMLGIRKYNHMEVFYSVFFLIRRFLFVVLLLSLEAHPAIAISILLLLNIAAMIYLGWVQPHDTRAS